MRLNAQYEIKPEEGDTPNIDLMVNKLEDLKDRITEQVKDLNQSQTDFQYDENANSTGSPIMHLVSTEAYYQIETLEGRALIEDEETLLSVAGEMNDETKKTLVGLKTKGDEWFASNLEEGVNYHWVCYHVMEHSANHMGQIGTVKNRLPN